MLWFFLILFYIIVGLVTIALYTGFLSNKDICQEEIITAVVMASVFWPVGLVVLAGMVVFNKTLEHFEQPEEEEEQDRRIWPQ